MDLANELTYRASATIAISGGDRLRPVLNTVSSLPVAPSQVTLAGDIFPKLRLVQPIVLSLEQSDGGKIVASDDLFNMYGEGNTRQQAVHDYLTSLAEYYELLESCEDPASVELFSFLQTYLHARIA